MIFSGRPRRGPVTVDLGLGLLENLDVALNSWSRLILPALGTSEVIPDSIWKRASSVIMIATLVVFFLKGT